MRRRFNEYERCVLYIAAQGLCSLCGTPLEPSWHADHIKAYSKGGPTVITNGQALCPKCNSEKGASEAMRNLRPWPDQPNPRKWHIKADRSMGQHEGRDFLLVATPGAGKTFFALMQAYKRLKRADIDRIVVVVPTDHLRKQWAQAAHDCGIDLYDNFSNSDGHEPPDFAGVVVTYQQVSFMPAIYDYASRRHPTMVILDEIHHAGDQLSWGNAVSEAFKNATFRLAMSGTPFRGDSSKIPFVNYEDGRSLPDFIYGYQDALSEGVCRHVFFPSFEGRMEWLNDDGVQVKTFADELDDTEASRRLRTALRTGEWLPEVFQQANSVLDDIRRNDQADAGGLVIAMDQEHAKYVAQMIRKQTGIMPVVAISEDPDASYKIEDFRKSNAPWIVAVKMVSEGVDIPRLRACVYATNVTSELFIRQAVGRVVRRIHGKEDYTAYFFIPKDERIVSVVSQIKFERDHELREECERSYERQSSDDDDPPPVFISWGSEARPDDLYYDHEPYSQAELSEASDLIRRLGLPIPPPQMAAILRYADQRPKNASTSAQEIPIGVPRQDGETQPKTKRMHALRKLIHKLAARYAVITGIHWQEVHYKWIEHGGMQAKQATEQDLERKRDWLMSLLRERGVGK